MKICVPSSPGFTGLCANLQASKASKNLEEIFFKRFFEVFEASRFAF